MEPANSLPTQEVPPSATVRACDSLGDMTDIRAMRDRAESLTVRVGCASPLAEIGDQNGASAGRRPRGRRRDRGDSRSSSEVDRCRAGGVRGIGAGRGTTPSRRRSRRRAWRGRRRGRSTPDSAHWRPASRRTHARSGARRCRVPGAGPEQAHRAGAVEVARLQDHDTLAGQRFERLGPGRDRVVAVLAPLRPAGGVVRAEGEHDGSGVLRRGRGHQGNQCSMWVPDTALTDVVSAVEVSAR